MTRASASRLIGAAFLLLTLASCRQGEDRSAEKPGLPSDASESDRAAPGTSPGTVTGAITYPSDYIPADLRVCAADVTSRRTRCGNERTDDSYRLVLPPGRYTVWAETKEAPGVHAFYSQAVPCGLYADCKDHSPIEIEVKPGATLAGVDPGDWYAAQHTGQHSAR